MICTGQPECRPRVVAEELLFADVPARASALLEAVPVESALSISLSRHGQVLGAVTVSALPSADLDQDAMVDLGRRAGVALDNTLSYSAQQRVGNDLQRSLMPSGMPAVSGVETATRYLPATGALAGGDFH